MKKMIWIVFAVTLLAALPLQASADEWEFIAEHHHKRVGGKFEPHIFRGCVCTQCGYQRDQTAGGTFTASLIDNSCWVHYDCALYNAPGGYRIGSAEQITNYYVGDYAYSDGIMWVLPKERADGSAPLVGWVDARNLRFDKSSGHIVEGCVIGCTIQIEASSGRGRTGPGTEYSYVETVHWRERYTILDQTIGSNGNTWYKIRVDGNPVWISSGLTKLV